MIQEMLDRQIRQQNLEKSKRYAHGKYNVSDAGRCRLMRYWKRTAQNVGEFDAETLRIFEVGNVFHETIQEMVTRNGKMRYCEHRMEDEHKVGHLDMVVQVEDNFHVLYDIKTCNSRSFSYAVQGKVSEHHAFQILTYYQMFEAENPGLVDECRMLYVEKDTFDMIEIKVPTDPQSLFAVEMDWAVLTDSEGEPEPNPKSWECKYCVFNQQCEYAQI